VLGKIALGDKAAGTWSWQLISSLGWERVELYFHSTYGMHLYAH